MDDLRRFEPTQRTIVSKHEDKVEVKKARHTNTSYKGLEYNIPIFANFDNIIQARPSHTSLTQSEVQKAELLEAMYKSSKGEMPIQEYLRKTGSPYELLEQTSENVMAVRNRTTGQTKVVVKGIAPTSALDHVELQKKLWMGEPTPTFNEALDLAQKYNAQEVLGHSRGGSTAIAVAQELGIESTGFNSVITTENVRNAHSATSAFKHTEFSNGEDIVVNGINELTNPHAHGKYPDNFDFKTYAGIEGEGIKGQHKVSQWTSEKLNRRDAIDLPMEELAFKSRHAGDLITAEMFAQGVREGKTYRQILHENEGGFGIVDDNGRFTSRNFRGNNMSQIFEAVGGEHTPDEITEMEAQGVQRPHEHTLTENELTGVKAGHGADMIDHALDNLAGTHERLPPVPTSKIRTIGKGIYRGVADSFKTEAFVEGVFGGLAGEAVASGVDRTIGKLPGELGELQHSAVSFGVAGGVLGGVETAGYGFVAGLAGEATRYGTDELLKKLGAGKDVRGNVDAIMSGAVSGAVMGSMAGPVGSAIGAGVGAVISEGAYVATHYGERIANFFEKIF
tara:strand:+ start:137 stop:1828 length:1692 start_codon:yes stop_codon:yes gene_type:complete